MNVLAGPYSADHTRLAIMFIRDVHGAPGDGSREKKPQQTPEDTDPIRDKIESRARPRVSWRSNKSSRGRLRFSNWSGKRFKTHMLHVLYRVLMNFKGRLFVSFPDTHVLKWDILFENLRKSIQRRSIVPEIFALRACVQYFTIFPNPGVIVAPDNIVLSTSHSPEALVTGVISVLRELSDIWSTFDW